MATSSQKFIARNRAPRVQIEYDVETYGSGSCRGPCTPRCSHSAPVRSEP